MPVINYEWDVLDDNVEEECDEVGNTIVEYTAEPGLYGCVISQFRQSLSTYYHFDGSGSATELTNDSGTVVNETRYSAFGVVVESPGNQANQMMFNAFAGYYRDESLDLYYVRARFLCARLGRWTSTDPILRPQMTPFAYADNNPVTLSDPSGLLPVSYQRCCPHKCSPKGNKKNCQLVGIALWPARRLGNPAQLESQFEALSDVLLIEDIQTGCAIGGVCCKIGDKVLHTAAEICTIVIEEAYEEATQGDLEENVKRVVYGWKRDLISREGAHIYLKFRWKECDWENCAVFWKRLDYDAREGSYRCRVPTPIQGISPVTPENVAKYLPGCIAKAQASLCAQPY